MGFQMATQFCASRHATQYGPKFGHNSMPVITFIDSKLVHIPSEVWLVSRCSRCRRRKAAFVQAKSGGVSNGVFFTDLRIISNPNGEFHGRQK